MGRRDPRCEVEDCKRLAVVGGTVCVPHGGQPPVRPTTNAPVDHMRLCGATRRDGGKCTQPARRGQDRCRMHGGSSPLALRKADERIVEAEVMELAERHGLPRSITSAAALREELARTQGRIDWLDAEVQRRPNDPSLLAVYTAERGHLRQLASGMVSAKVDERAAVVTEQAMDVMERAVTATLRDYGLHADDPHVRESIARHIEAYLTAGQPDAAVVLADSAYAADWPTPEPVAF